MDTSFTDKFPESIDDDNDVTHLDCLRITFQKIGVRFNEIKGKNTYSMLIYHYEIRANGVSFYFNEKREYIAHAVQGKVLHLLRLTDESAAGTVPNNSAEDRK